MNNKYNLLSEEKKEMIRQKNLKYYHDNKEKVALRTSDYYKNYYQKHKQKMLERQKIYYNDNFEYYQSKQLKGEELRKYNKKYYQKNKIKIRERQRKHYKIKIYFNGDKSYYKEIQDKFEIDKTNNEDIDIAVVFLD